MFVNPHGHHRLNPQLIRIIQRKRFKSSLASNPHNIRTSPNQSPIHKLLYVEAVLRSLGKVSRISDGKVGCNIVVGLDLDVGDEDKRGGRGHVGGGSELREEFGAGTCFVWVLVVAGCAFQELAGGTRGCLSAIAIVVMVTIVLITVMAMVRAMLSVLAMASWTDRSRFPSG